MGSSNDLRVEDIEAAVMAEDTTVQLSNIDEENMKGSGSEITESMTSDSSSLENINDDATTTSQSQSSSSATSSLPLKVDDDTINNTMDIVDKENTRNNQSPTRQEGRGTTDTDTTDSDSMMSIMDDRSTDKSPSTKEIITEPQQQHQPSDMEVEVEEKSSKKVKYSNDAEKKEVKTTNNLSSASEAEAIQIIDNDGKSEKDGVVEEEQKMEEDVMRSKIDALTEKKLGEDLDSALDALRESISVAILAQRKEDDKSSENDTVDTNDEDKKKANEAYSTLRDAAMKAYHSLVVYGSSMDLSAQSGDSNISNSDDEVVLLSETRRKRLLTAGRKLWMEIRGNPEIFSDMVLSSSQVDSSQSVDVSSYEGKKSKAIAGAYARAVTARLVFLNYIDTRSSIGRAPELFNGEWDDTKTASLQELKFGLKLFSRAGKTMLEHKKDARSSYDTLSLAVSCFDAISDLASGGNEEAAKEVQKLYDEAFDAIALLPNAASLFGQLDSNRVPRKGDDVKHVPWQRLVLKNLERVESFVDSHCNVFKGTEDDSIKQSASKLSTLQRFLPSLARLCSKHGSHFMKIREYENANKCLKIALASSNNCLIGVKRELDPDCKSKSNTMLQNLEKELVVVTIEAFYLLSLSYQRSGMKDKAVLCLDKIESFMQEQHDRDMELHSKVMNMLSDGKAFVFSEGAATSSLAGPKSHFDKDEADIKRRAQSEHDDVRNRHDQEKATLAFSRIMLFHNTLPHPSSEEESLIDTKMRSAAQLAVSSSDSKKDSDKIFDLALDAIRRVHLRRTISKVSGTTDSETSYTDNYKLLLDKLPKTHFRRPFVMLDKLNAMLAAEYQVRESKLGDKTSIKRLDNEALRVAKEYMDIVKVLLEKSSASGTRGNDSTLFVTSNQSLSNELVEETKIHFLRGISLYESLDAHEMCAQWSDLLQSIILVTSKANMSEDTDVLLGNVMTVKAHAQSMSGSIASGLKTAREAWEKVKTVDSLVTLFHCSLRHELKFQSCDTMLEFDTALQHLLSTSSECTEDEVLAAFPRLFNHVEDEVSNGQELILLGVQEKWLDILVGSKTLKQQLKEKNLPSEAPDSTLFDILRAYLNNFEHVVSNKSFNATSRNFDALVRIVDAVLKLLVHVRETKQPQKKTPRRKKQKKGVDGADKDVVKLVWDIPVVKTLVGSRTDVVWMAEQLWNISNMLLAVSLGSSATGNRSDPRNIAAEVFAASHDFCLLSEEEEGSCLSKGFLDYDIKFDPTKSVLPTFDIFSAAKLLPSNISSEFSGQCLLISVATAVDYASSLGGGVAALDNDVQILLSRSLHRLAHAKEEMKLNCEDEHQISEVNKMVALLALRCLLGVGEDSLAYESLNNNGLYLALRQLHITSSLNQSDDEMDENQYVILKNVKLMADVAEERNMTQTSLCLQRLCATMLSMSGKFSLDLGDEYEVSLGEIQRSIILSASTAKEVVDVFDNVQELVEKHGKSPFHSSDDGSFYSTNELNWLGVEANNRAVTLNLLEDYDGASQLFAVALSLLPHCGKEFKYHGQSINTAYQHVLSQRTSRDALSSILNLTHM